MTNLRNALLVQLFSLAGVLSLCAAEKPNFLFIFADDQCWNTVHALGNMEVKTPNLDRLSQSGTSFLNAYNMGGWNGAVCIASRTMLNTGRTVWRAHQIEPELGNLSGRGELWAQLLAKAGYETFFSGKWHIKIAPEQVFDHVAHERPGMPEDRYGVEAEKLDWKLPEGFANSIEGYSRPRKGITDPWSPWERSFGGYWEGGKHWSEVLGDDAEAFLNAVSTSEKPFFMYLAFNAPHDPRQSPKRFVDMYPLETIEIPQNYMPMNPYKDEIGCDPGLRDEALAPFPRTEYAVKTHRQEYYAIISHLDEQIGRILAALEKSGKKDNTYIIFTADHGLAVGQHGFIGKQNMFEHSVKPPLIIVGPSIPEDERRDALVYLQDIMPTTLDLAGLDIPPYVEFTSLIPAIANPDNKDEGKRVYGCYLKDMQRMIREGDLKLIVYPHAHKVLLFDVKNDPLEMKDLTGDPRYWDTVKRLVCELQKLEKQMGGELELSEYFPELI